MVELVELHILLIKSSTQLFYSESVLTVSIQILVVWWDVTWKGDLGSIPSQD